MTFPLDGSKSSYSTHNRNLSLTITPSNCVDTNIGTGSSDSWVKESGTTGLNSASSPISLALLSKAATTTASTCSFSSAYSVYIPGGLYLAQQAMVAGDRTLEEVARWNFDLALLGAQGIDENGLWNSQRDISHQQREVIRRSDQTLICMHKSKLGRSGPSAVTRDIAPLYLVVDADAAMVTKAKVKMPTAHIISA
jgi:DeoR/GlpR family transcriptional regulator of sugar metabolism